MTRFDKEPSPARAEANAKTLADLLLRLSGGRTRAVFQVGSTSRVGLLFVHDGIIVHATMGELEGTAAAREIAGWRHGTVTICMRPWPAKATTHLPLRALETLGAELASDEVEEVTIPIVVEEDRGPAIASGSMTVIPERLDPHSCFPVEVDRRIAHAALVGPDGVVLCGKGDAENLGALASYTARLARIVGDALALDAFEGLLGRFEHQDCAIRRVGDGWGIAVGEPGVVEHVRWNN